MEGKKKKDGGLPTGEDCLKGASGDVVLEGIII